MKEKITEEDVKVTKDSNDALFFLLFGFGG